MAQLLWKPGGEKGGGGVGRAFECTLHEYGVGLSHREPPREGRDGALF